mmetsp:Transcript_64356/g.145159  ORF Transcript_64356/g.145159 Transcript_64356/m.145159 type:complete len:81 (-) Transcript_64356:461-703(-)
MTRGNFSRLEFMKLFLDTCSSSGDPPNTCLRSTANAFAIETEAAAKDAHSGRKMTNALNPPGVSQREQASMDERPTPRNK